MRNRWVSLRMWHRLGSEKSETYKSHLVKVRKNVSVFWDLVENDRKERECHGQRCQDGKHDGLFVGDGKCFVSPELKVQMVIESSKVVLVS